MNRTSRWLLLVLALGSGACVIVTERPADSSPPPAPPAPPPPSPVAATPPAPASAAAAPSASSGEPANSALVPRKNGD